MATPTQIENLRMAYAIMWGVPAERIDLDKTRDTSLGPAPDEKFAIRKCTTMGCIAGWLSAHPHFQAQGLHWEDDLVILGDERSFSFQSKELFGNNTLFAGGPHSLIGKRYALKRIRIKLYEVGAISVERNNELETAEQRLKN